MTIKEQLNADLCATTGNNNVFLVQRKLIPILESFETVVILNQLIYWSDKTEDPNRWIYKTFQQWEIETCCKRKIVERARRKLLELNLIETSVKTAPNDKVAVHYRLVDDFNERLKQLIMSHNNEKLETNAPTVQSIRPHSTFTIVPPVQLQTSSECDSINNIDYNNKDYNNRDYPEIVINNFCEEMLAVWNDQLIIKHKKYNREVQAYLNYALNEYDFYDIITAIKNYGKIYKSDDYYFNFKYTLLKFIKDGVRDLKGFVNFLDSSDPFTRFKKFEKDLDPWEKLRQEFKPTTVKYTDIMDKTEGTYYGFEMRYIKEPWDYIRDINIFLSSKWYDEHNDLDNNLWTLELSIAGILFHRKTHPERFEQLEHFMNTWRKHKE